MPLSANAPSAVISSGRKSCSPIASAAGGGTALPMASRQRVCDEPARANIGGSLRVIQSRQD
jgi:hypothetical protein